jgi:hypothetical protein
MTGDEKGPPADPNKKPEEAAGDTAGAGDAAPGEVPMNRAQRRAKKHGRKGELRDLHDRDKALRRDTTRHSAKMFRRKSI